MSLTGWTIPRARSDRVVWYCGLVWVDRSPIYTLLEASSSAFGNDPFQAISSESKTFLSIIPVIVQRVFGCAIDACSRFASHRRISFEWARLFHLGCTALYDVHRDDQHSTSVLRDDQHMKSLMLQKSLPFSSSKEVSSSTFSACPGFHLKGISPRGGLREIEEFERDLSAHGNHRFSCVGRLGAWLTGFRGLRKSR